MKKVLPGIFSLLFFIQSDAQTTVGTLVNQVSQSGVIKMVREFSGEDNCIVEGSTVTIKNRVSSKGNNLAASYIKEKFLSYGLTPQEINYSSGGRNVVAKKTGSVNPSKIFLISAHYDAVADYCADDNASGTVGVLEAARILSQYTFENTVVFALWDEEETGLKGAQNYAASAKSKGDDIIGVVNIDMMGVDQDNDKRYDIDVRNIANSYAIKNDLLSLTSTYGLNLVGHVVDPGTSASDHSAFWNKGYSAVLLGEAWSKNDITPGYHSSSDRISYFNSGYYFEMCKLLVSWIATKAVLVNATGLPEWEAADMTVYPNPASEHVSVDLVRELDGQLVIYNLVGEQVEAISIHGLHADVDVTGLPSGIYFIRPEEKYGRKGSAIKLIVE